MLLKLIKTRPMITGIHCELWEINTVIGNKHLANVFLLEEHVPSELIYRLTLTFREIRIAGKPCPWQWTVPMERLVTEYLLSVQAIREEIYLEFCDPEPDLPGYPYTDYHPDDYPIVLDESE